MRRLLSRDALRAGRAHPTGYSVGGTAQLALRTSTPSLQQGPATLQVLQRPDGAAGGRDPERRCTTEAALFREPSGSGPVQRSGVREIRS